HFVEKYAGENGKAITGVAPEAMQALMDYDWPGNVRELENVIERGVVLTTAPQIGRDLIPDHVRTAPSFHVPHLTVPPEGALLRTRPRPRKGPFASVPLPDIIQLISVSGKTGVFHLTSGALAGEIYLSDGKIVHAQLDDVSGEEAVYALAMWSQGDFRFDPGVAIELRTITKSNTNLLMEAARRLDEWRVLSKKIPFTDMAAEFVGHEPRDGQNN